MEDKKSEQRHGGEVKFLWKGQCQPHREGYSVQLWTPGVLIKQGTFRENSSTWDLP
jgi:hypothetical protein